MSSVSLILYSIECKIENLTQIQETENMLLLQHSTFYFKKHKSQISVSTLIYLPELCTCVIINCYKSLITTMKKKCGSVYDLQKMREGYVVELIQKELQIVGWESKESLGCWINGRGRCSKWYYRIELPVGMKLIIGFT